MNQAVAHVARPSNRANAVERLKSPGNAARDSRINLCWTVAWPVGCDDHLILRQVGNGIHGNLLDGKQTADRCNNRERQNSPAPLHRKSNDVVQH